jgi:iron complex outermembrane receptor protein
MAHRLTPLLVRLAAIAVCLSALPAAAQTFDYGELEKIFDEPVTTSATGKPQRKSETPATMDIITAEDIRRSGATTIPQLLQRLPRLDVYTWSQSSADVAIGGLNQGASSRVMVLVNGRENYQDALGALAWQQIPVSLDEIRQIEVIKGPNSALFGFNAYAGVINIITNNPAFDTVDAARGTIGSNGVRNASVVRSFRFPKGGLRLSAGFTQSNDTGFHPAFADDRIASAHVATNRTFSADGQVELGEATQLRLQAGVTQGSTRVMYQFPIYLNLATYATQLELTSTTRAGLLDLNISHTITEADPVRSTILNGKIHNPITIVKLSDLFKLGVDDSFRLAGEMRFDDLTTFPEAIGKLHSQDMSASMMWEHVFSDTLTMTNAARVDRFALGRTGPFLALTPYTNDSYNRRTMTEPSFNTALVWRPTEADTLKAIVARGLTLPSLGEFGVANGYAQPITLGGRVPVVVPGRVLIYGNPNLKTSRSDSYELSYERAVPAWGGTARIAAYHQELHNIRDLVIGGPVTLRPPTLTGTFLNVGNAIVDGFDIDLKGKSGVIRWGANYSYEKIRASVPHTFHIYETSTPRHKINAQLGFDVGQWEFDSTLRYVSSTEFLQQTALSQYQAYRVNNVLAVSQRAAYNIAPSWTIEATVNSGYADNPVWGQGFSALFSVVSRY